VNTVRFLFRKGEATNYGIAGRPAPSFLLVIQANASEQTKAERRDRVLEDLSAAISTFPDPVARKTATTMGLHDQAGASTMVTLRPVPTSCGRYSDSMTTLAVAA
jgi:hypothetical protein